MIRQVERGADRFLRTLDFQGKAREMWGIDRLWSAASRRIRRIERERQCFDFVNENKLPPADRTAFFEVFATTFKIKQ